MSTVPNDLETPLARFGNDVSDSEVFDIDINLGRMLLPSFYRLERLGKNIYIYDGKSCGSQTINGGGDTTRDDGDVVL